MGRGGQYLLWEELSNISYGKESTISPMGRVVQYLLWEGEDNISFGKYRPIYFMGNLHN